MKVARKDTSPTKLSLTITAGAEDLAPIKHHVLRHFAGNVKVPGFRAGHAPANMVEKYANQQALLDEFMEHALNDLYGKAIDAEKIRPAGQPKVSVKKFVPYTTLEFEAEIEVIGQIKLANYRDLKRTVPKATVSAKDVEGVLRTLQQRSAQRKETTKPAKDGDELLIDFAGTDAKGQVLPNTEGKDYPLVLGSGSFIPGFEENLLGAKKGEAKEFQVTFPDDYQAADMRGKKVTFKVGVKKVSELINSKLDDEFAKAVGPFKNLAELKADIKKQLQLDGENEAKTQFQNQLVAEIANKSEVDVPDSLVQDQLLRMEEDEKRNLVYQGKTWQEHLKEENLTEQGHRDRHRDQAYQRVKGGLVLSEIAEREDIQVSQKEIDERITLLKGQYNDPAMQAELDKSESRREIAGRLMTEKTVAKIVAYATKKK